MTFFRHATPNFPAKITAGDHLALQAELALAGDTKAKLGAYAVRRHPEDTETFVMQRESLVPGWLRQQVVLQPDQALGGYAVGTVGPLHRLFSRVTGMPDIPTEVRGAQAEEMAMLSARLSLGEAEAEE